MVEIDIEGIEALRGEVARLFDFHAENLDTDATVDYLGFERNAHGGCSMPYEEILRRRKSKRSSMLSNFDALLAAARERDALKSLLSDAHAYIGSYGTYPVLRDAMLKRIEEAKKEKA